MHISSIGWGSTSTQRSFNHPPVITKARSSAGNSQPQFSGWLFKSKAERRGFVKAADRGDLQAVQNYLKQGFSVNTKDASYTTPLMSACEKGHLPIVNHLLSIPGVDVNEMNSDGKTALMYAAQNGYTPAVKVLLNHKTIDVNAKDKRQGTALISAALNGHAEVVKLLLQRPELNVNHTPSYGHNAMTASAAGDIGDTKINVLHALLADPRVDVNLKNGSGVTTLLLLAEKYASKEVMDAIDLLLNHRAIDVNATNFNQETAFLKAVQQDGRSTAIVDKLLADPRVDVTVKNKSEQNALHLASAKSPVILERLLTDPRLDRQARDVSGKTPFLAAAESFNYSNMLPLWLSLEDTDVYAVDNQGRNALMLATLHGTHNDYFAAKVLSLLKDGRLDPNLQDNEGNTALMHAVATYGRNAAVRALLEDPRTYITIKNKRGETVLSKALNVGNQDILKLLSRHPQMDYTVRNQFGTTPLHTLALSDPNFVRNWFQTHPEFKNTPLEKDIKSFNGISDLKLILSTAGYSEEQVDSAFVSELPKLVRLEPAALQNILQAFESRMDGERSRTLRRRSYHPNEAELFALTRYLDLFDTYRTTMPRMISSATSIARFMEVGVGSLDEQTVKNWSEIGFWTYAFKLWKYDARQGANGQKSLLERYGFTKLKRLPTDDERYGPGFILTPSRHKDLRLHPHTLIEFRRGYVLATHPQHGTVVIRNSSPVYGRDRMLHPAYYSRKALSVKELEQFHLKDVQHVEQSSLSRKQRVWQWAKAKVSVSSSFYPIMTTPSLYKNPRFNADLSVLLSELSRLKSHYTQWKMDIHRYQDDRFSGHKAEGFTHIVDVVRQLAQKRRTEGKPDEPVAELAFYHPKLPPFHAYATYSLDRAGLKGLLAFTTLYLPEWAKENGIKPYKEQDEAHLFRFLAFLKQGTRYQAELILQDPGQFYERLKDSLERTTP